MNPPAKTIAVANDAAFGFAYHHLLAGWQQQGAEIRPFSPLNDEKPADDADFIFLPGGYPELHLPTLSTNRQFLAGLNRPPRPIFQFMANVVAIWFLAPASPMHQATGLTWLVFLMLKPALPIKSGILAIANSRQ